MSKNALITGASRGIGAALAYKFASMGYNLSICSRNSAVDLETIAADVSDKYAVPVLTFVGDVSDEEFVHDMIEETMNTFGNIDVLINNAGIAYIGLLADMSLDEWNRVIGTNLTSAFLTSKYAVPGMVARKQGKIINISSVWGNVGASCEVAYSASKGGLNSFTKALGKELAPSNVQVNAISCGVIDTEMNSCFSDEDKIALADEIPAGRFGKASEVADLAYSLATESGYLTGQVITIDGGWQ